MVYVQYPAGYPQEDLEKLKKIAKQDTTSVAYLLRQSVKNYIKLRGF